MVVETNYESRIHILKYPDHKVAMTVVVDDTGVPIDASGRKVISAGTIVGGAAGAALDDDTQPVMKKNGAGAEGVLLDDADVTYGPAQGAMLLHGFVDLNKLPEPPSPDAIETLGGRIVFLK